MSPPFTLTDGSLPSILACGPLILTEPFGRLTLVSKSASKSAFKSASKSASASISTFGTVPFA